MPSPLNPPYRIVTRHLDIDISRPKSKQVRESLLHGNLVVPQSRPLSDNRDVRRNNPQPANPSIP